VKSDISVHSWNSGSITVEPTESSKGEMLYKCIICGAEKTKEIPVLTHEHTYNKEWSSDDYIHWHGTSCGHDLKMDIAIHIWDAGTVVTPATENNTGEKLYKCVVCKHEKTEIIPKVEHVHTFSDDWTSDADLHWHAASCGHDVKSDIAAHVWNSGTIITSPGEYTEGEMLYKCILCGEEKTQAIPVIGHEHKYNTAWSTNAYMHWHAASCGHDVKIDTSAHIWSEGVVTTPATEESTGIMTYTCVLCE
jgi:DNA-directed RNA polymerase subunit RPC12/RpoP